MLKEFQKGNFSFRRLPGKFNRLPSDQVIERTVNQDQKGPGGIIGFSTTEGTVQRCILTRPITARLISQMEDSLQLTKPENVPKDLAATRVSYVESKIKSCIQVLQSWVPMFEDKKNLYNLSSEYHAHEDIEKDLLNAEVIGRKLQEEFVNDRIKIKEISFYYPIKKNKLKTFSTNISKVSSKTRKVLAERDMFNRVLVAREFAEEYISLKELLSFSLSPVALSLSSSDGSLYKGCKASLLQYLEKGIPSSDL